MITDKYKIRDSIIDRIEKSDLKVTIWASAHAMIDDGQHYVHCAPAIEIRDPYGRKHRIQLVDNYNERIESVLNWFDKKREEEENVKR